MTHPDGGVAIVGSEPRELHPKFWRNAARAGCQSDAGIRAAELPPIAPKDDAFTRKQKIKDAMIAAVNADPEDEAYADAFTANDVPSVRWLEKKVGFGLTSDERDTAWNEVQAELPDPDDNDENEEQDD